MSHIVTSCFTGTSKGFFWPASMLRRDYSSILAIPRAGRCICLWSFIGAAIGAVIVPAVIEKEYAAISFLILAASPVQEVRNLERATLGAMESTELVKRGTAYIEGIAWVYKPATTCPSGWPCLWRWFLDLEEHYGEASRLCLGGLVGDPAAQSTCVGGQGGRHRYCGVG